MQQVHHGEFLLAVVGGGQIDGHAALLTQRRTVVPYARQRAVRHVVYSIQMTFILRCLRHDEDIAQRRDVTIDVAVGGVYEALAVHGQTV